MQEFVSDFIGKELLSRSGERIGYIKNIQTDKKLTTLKNAECCDTEEEEFCLPCSALIFGRDAAVVKRLCDPCKNCFSLPFGLQVFSDDGLLLGTVSDFTRDGLTVGDMILSDNRSIPVRRIAAVSDTVILLPEGKEQRVVRTGNPPEKKAPSAKTKRAQTARQDGSVSPSPAREQDVRSASAPQTALRAGRGLLTGKILPRDLKDARGIVLAKAGSPVTPQIIRKAMAHEKLFELTLLCCRDIHAPRT